VQVRAQEAKRPQPYLENRTAMSLAQTVQKIQAEAARKGWKVPVIHNLQESLAKAGKTITPVQVLELCKPLIAHKILSNDQVLGVAAFMPCRVAVYETTKGEVIVSRMNGEAFASMFPPAAIEPMKEASQEMESILKEALR
jgi:uncharacterized protein (DUF302 family)